MDTTAHLDNNHEATKSKFHPLYNKILNYWFPAAEHYDVCPHWIIPDASPQGSNDPEDYTISFLITRQQQPLLLLEVKAPSDFHATWRRESVIQQLTYCLDVIGPMNRQVGRLYAIPAIGKQRRAVYVGKGKGSRDHSGHSVKGIAAVNSLRSADAQCWNSDITSEASWEALKGIVQTIKSYNI